MMKKFAIFLTSIILTFSVLNVKAEAASFTDVKTADRFFEEISYLVDEEIISGYPDGTFKPNKVLTRAEAAIMIGRALKLDGTQNVSKFKDVHKSSGASGYIASAVSKGIISGYPDGTFRPNVAISRGDMSIILSRAFNLYYESAYKFKDVGEGMSAYSHILRLSLASISAGYPDGTYRPQENVTRAQFSAFLARAMSVEFKQKAAIENSYTRDKTKQYTYNTQRDGQIIATFKDGGIGNSGENLGHLWVVTNVQTKNVEYVIEDESYEGLVSAYPMSEYDVSLLYPIKLGNEWGDFEEINKITAVNQTVTTPYQTFTNAVEVTGSKGNKLYYVKHIGFVKHIDESGKVVSELIDIK